MTPTLQSIAAEIKTIKAQLAAREAADRAVNDSLARLRGYCQTLAEGNAKAAAVVPALDSIVPPSLIPRSEVLAAVQEMIGRQPSIELPIGDNKTAKFIVRPSS